jgi:DNA (cytosine-5)-methyltransferase 1
MRRKTGEPKLRALRNRPSFRFGFRTNPATRAYRNPLLGESEVRLSSAPVRAVSLFCGCGGLDLGMYGGFRYLGVEYGTLPFQIVAAFDNNPRALETYRLNVADHVRACDLATVDVATLPKAELLLGGFPCQDFSSCGPKQGFEGRSGRLYRVLSDYLRVHRPLVALGENVPHLAKMREGHYLREIADDFASQGYRVKVWQVCCPDYGLPQRRHRVFFICVRDDLPGQPRQPAPTHAFRHRPIEEAIDDLKDITDESVPNQSQYFVATKATAGAGQGDQTSTRGQVAYAVRANPKARVHFHYELPRRLTVRECARLQSFPDEFVFPHAASANMMDVGNAVPPIIAHAVGRELFAYFQSLRRPADNEGAVAC